MATLYSCHWSSDGYLVARFQNHVKHWFYHDKGHNGKMEKQRYEDIYLYTPEVDYSSVKFRDNKLDIKWKRSSFEIDVESSKSMNISGIVEDWVFWGRPLSLRKSGSAEYIPLRLQ